MRIPIILAVTLLVAVLAVLRVSPAAHAEDEIPDLEVKFDQFLPLPNGERSVRFRVTNLSTWWANETTLTVRAVTPGAANPQGLFVENLDPGQSTIVTYTLPEGGCDGHEVVAILAPAKNYAGVLETKLNNNRAPQDEKPGEGQKLCGAKSQGVDPSRTGVVINRIPTDLVVIPEHMRPGTHSLVFEASDGPTTRGRKKTWDSLDCFMLEIERPAGLVGWAQNLGAPIDEDRCTAEVHMTAINFDLKKLDDVPRKTVNTAVLTYTEEPFSWRETYGTAKVYQGCVNNLGLATLDWTSQSFDGLFPHTVHARSAAGAQEWGVTAQVDGWASGRSPRFGFVLASELGLDELEGYGLSSCLSLLDNFRLTVTYTVPQ